MRTVVLVSLFSACLALGQTGATPVVSSAFGNSVTLDERDLGGVLVFTLTNGMPSAVQQYAIEVWGMYERGPAHRFCSLTASDADLSPDATVSLPDVCALRADPSLGNPVSHASRIVAVQLANGWKWHAPTAYRVQR